MPFESLNVDRTWASSTMFLPLQSVELPSSFGPMSSQGHHAELTARVESIGAALTGVLTRNECSVSSLRNKSIYSIIKE